ncbi:L-lactate permease [Helicobacter sp. 16-1353]|uniref:lactate permease LctP family transporter n=1 Tax=Helicobacter sp. 16-1353 TaxID=2004996 RepID=UPI000DCB0BD6|nr:lactate permease LctP family transporter [Helicobacter sp. 16-1353]RAX55306.1 L-lactate permease [Helicobacter sp. 16-1353]
MFIQNYDPLNNVWLSALVAFLPILLFFLSLVVFKMKGHTAGLVTVILAAIVAVVAYQMPVSMVLGSFLYGFLYGMWPIAWIIVAAIFLYKLSVKSGYFDILRESIIAITPDQRLQVILIGFCFGAFLEGAIGFGGPVAITAALLVGMGLRPLYAAGLCMIANTAPVAFGAVGIPIIAMAGVVGVDSLEISSMAGRMLPPLSLFIPFFLVFLMDGFKGIKETYPALLVTGLSFALVQFITSNYMGPELPDIASAVVSIAALSVFLKFWKPKHIFKFDEEIGGKATLEVKKYSFGQIALAWSPFIVLIIMIVIWTQGWFKALFGGDGILASTVINIPISVINGNIMQVAPVVAEDTPIKVVFSWNLINTVGTAIFVTAIISMFMLKVKVGDAVKTFGETLNEMKFAILTIGLVLSFAFISNYSGISAALALALASTGDAFTFFSPIVGWIGVFLTGSDTSSNLLFGTLQQVTARQLGIPEVLFLAANSVGGVVGKMISPQSIAIACAAVGLVGRESELFRFTVKYSIIFVIVIGLFTSFIAFVIPWLIP